jgi:N6-L-threonylcarbamoyladenine synthase
MSTGIQQAIIDVLLKKTIKAAKDYKVKSIILGGGVSANKELRAQLAERIQKWDYKIKCLIPEASLSTDNALMVAIAGFFNSDKKVKWQKIEAKSNLRIG